MIDEGRYCRCIYISHCDRRHNCKLNAYGSVNKGGGVCPPPKGAMTRDDELRLGVAPYQRRIERFQRRIEEQEKRIRELSEELSRTRYALQKAWDEIYSLREEERYPEW